MQMPIRKLLILFNLYSDFHEKLRPGKEEVALLTKKGRRSFRDMPVSSRMFLIFGSETKGLPEDILSMFPGATFHIPITREIRSLNLSTAAGIVLYESYRQGGIRHEY